MAIVNERFGQTPNNYYSGDGLGNYQFVSLRDIISNFTLTYVGENKIISKVGRSQIAFHAQRAIQELSYDTFKSIKSQEIILPPSLVMKLPQDYVNYTKLCWSDSSGIEHVIYPAIKTSNPSRVAQDSDGLYLFEDHGSKKRNEATDTPNPVDEIYQFPGTRDNPFTTAFRFGIDDIAPNSTGPFTINVNSLNNPVNQNNDADPPDTNPLFVGMEIISIRFPAGTTIASVSEADTTTPGVFTFTTSNATFDRGGSGRAHVTFLGNSRTWGEYKSHTPSENNVDDYEDDVFWPNMGGRFGLDPQHAQVNGSFYIDELRGRIHFSSNISGKTVILKYISDGLGSEDEMIVHKFAEEAMYKSIALGILSTSASGQALVPRFKKEKYAAVRTAKLRLSNLKIEELTQIMRGKSKVIKH